MVPVTKDSGTMAFSMALESCRIKMEIGEKVYGTTERESSE